MGDGGSAAEAEAKGLSAAAAMTAAMGQQLLLKGQRRGPYLCCEALAALAERTGNMALQAAQRQAAMTELHAARRELLAAVFACGGQLPLLAGGKVTVRFRLDVLTAGVGSGCS